MNTFLEYDERGNLIKKSRYSNTQEIYQTLTWEYDIKNNRTLYALKYFGGTESGFIIRYEYEESGVLSEERYYTHNDELVRYTVYQCLNEGI